MSKILLFIPVYNCENQILKVLNQIDLSVLEYISEIIVIDNISNDNTLNKIKTYFEEHKSLPASLLQNKDNYNLGGSHKVAFQYALDNNFDYIAVLHGDNQGSISDLIPILKNNTHHNFDCCLGARFKKDSKLVGYSKFKIFGNIFFNILFSIALKKKIYDLGSGLNIYNINMLKDKFYIKFPDNLSFNYCMTMALDYHKHTYMFFPLTWSEDDQISNVKIMNQAFNLLKMLFQYIINKKIFIKSELRKTKVQNYEYECIYTNKVN